MHLLQLPRPYREAVGAFEALRRLGFRAEEIYIEACGDGIGPTQIVLRLRSQGREFTMHAGVLAEPRERVLETWLRIANAMGSGDVPEDELESVWHSCVACNQGVSLLSALLQHGFKFPKCMS